MLFGTGDSGDRIGYLYESLDGGATIDLLNGVPVEANGTFKPPGKNSRANVGDVTALVYGGNQLGTPKPNVAFVGSRGGPGSNKGHKLLVRQERPGEFLPVTSFRAAGGGTVAAIAIDPSDWRNVYVLDNSDHLWFSKDGDQPITANPDGTFSDSWSWTDLTRNLPSLPGGDKLQSVEVARDGGQVVILVGGVGGVYRLIGQPPWSSGARWTEFGVNLPNSLVTDIDSITPDDLMLLGTLGRGIWTLPNASTVLAQKSELILNGTNDNDAFHLQRGDEKEPWLLHVFQFPANTIKPTEPTLSVRMSTLAGITINGAGGDDDFIIDLSNGVFDIAGTVNIDGGPHGPAGDELEFLGTGLLHGTPAISLGSTHFAVSFDPFGAFAIQRTDFQNVENPDASGLTVAQDLNTIRGRFPSHQRSVTPGPSVSSRHNRNRRI